MSRVARQFTSKQKGTEGLIFNPSVPFSPCAGFTLIELILVIVLLGILSVYASSRFADSGTFALRAGQDQLVSAARYAQELAMVRHATADDPVALVVGSDSYQVSVAKTVVTLPAGETAAELPDGVTATPAPITVTFNDSLGNIDSVAAVTITLSASGQTRDVCIETSGYAHAC